MKNTLVCAAAALLLLLTLLPGRAAATHRPPDGWAITFEARGSLAREKDRLTLGAASAAADGMDDYDDPLPPRFPFHFLDLYTEHSRTEPGWSGQAAATLRYRAEYQSPLGAAERAMPIQLTADRTGPVTLTWTGVAAPELEPYDVLLRDLATGESVDLRAVTSHTLSVQPGTRTLQLALVPGRGAPTPPVLSPAPDQSATEGFPVPFNLGGFTDTGADGPWTVETDWGDGSAHSTLSMPIAGSLPATAHSYADNGSYLVTVRVTDQTGAFGTADFDVTVANVAPTATLNAPATADEGMPFTLELTDADDPSPADTAAGFTYAFDCGGGYGGFGPSTTANCTATGSGAQTVRGKVADKDGGTTEYTATVVINAQPTSPVLIPAPDQPATEGFPVPFNLGGFTDAAADGPWTVDADWGDGAAHATLSMPIAGSLPATAHSYADNGSYLVTVRVTDQTGAFGTANFSVAVANVAPMFTAAPDQTATAGTVAAFSLGAFTDPGADSPWALDVDWGDGSAHTAFSAAATGSVGTQSHTYAAAGTYRVTVTVTDKDGAAGTASFTVTVAPPGTCSPLTWLAPTSGSTAQDVPVNSTFTIRFSWGDCHQFIHDESVIMQVENPDDPNLPITSWVYGRDITIDDTAGEYRVNFTPGLYGLTPGATYTVTVFIGGQLVGQALLHLTP